jgi:nitrite reductase (NO-forming)
VIQSTLTRQRAVPIDRSTDRLVALGSIVAATAFLLAALVVVLAPPSATRALWLPLHLALAGGATTAIAGVMPFFVAAFAAAPPADPRIRVSSLVSIVAGAAAVTVGVTAGIVAMAVGGGGLFIVGIGLTGLAAIVPLRHALGPSRGLVTKAYLAALVFVAVGATTATLFLAGWPPIVEAWARVRPAHAWLNLVGFVSLLIATTLVHFFPTTVGGRIATHWTARATVLGVALGGALVPLGYAADLDTVARAGAVCTIVGASALVAYAARIWRTRHGWTTDAPWHRFVIGGLMSAMGWFVAGSLVAGGRVLVAGAAPSGWSADIVAAPLVAGWVGIAVIASASHLLPAVGPGDNVAHRRQRQILGRAATSRLAALDLGVAALFLGAALGVAPLVTGGTLFVAAGYLLTAGLLARAVAVGLASRAGDGS